MGLDFLPVPQTGDEYRELTPDEIQSVAHHFKEAGVPLPNPAQSTFVGCVRGGKVLGFIVIQLRLHAEPMVIEDGHSEIFPRLVKTAESVIITRCGAQVVFLFTPAGRISQLAQTMGCQMEPWVIMSKVVAPEKEETPVVALPEMPSATEVVQ